MRSAAARRELRFPVRLDSSGSASPLNVWERGHYLSSRHVLPMVEHRCFSLLVKADNLAGKEPMMNRDFQQIQWDAAAEAECRRIVQWAVREDLDGAHSELVKLLNEEEEGPLLGRCNHAGLLWALAGLAWPKEHLGTSARGGRERLPGRLAVPAPFPRSCGPRGPWATIRSHRLRQVS